MNYYNDDDSETSIRCRNIVRLMMTDGMKRKFMAGTYVCAGDDRRTVALNGFLGSKILGSNLIIAVANRILYPAPGLLTQEVSRFTTRETSRQE